VNVYSQTVTVHLKDKVSGVSPQFWGSNFLYWVDDDASLANNKLAGLLREMPCNVLRYPGGTVADNFHWESATLDNVNKFPFESGKEESDFDEFMNFCKKVGAEPMLVVNTESWFLKGKVDEGAKKRQTG
jgi:alpha-L-arabinofuranosidase